MNVADLRNAWVSCEMLEYHLMGIEHGATLLPGPGWYPCVIDEICKNGNVEIVLTTQDDIGVTVLKKNIPIAFRRII
jgi:hypothetical protein